MDKHLFANTDRSQTELAQLLPGRKSVLDFSSADITAQPNADDETRRPGRPRLVAPRTKPAT
jgi:hypothetical protein